MHSNPNENSCPPRIQEKDSDTAIRSPIPPIRDILIEDCYYILHPRKREAVEILSRTPKRQRNSNGLDDLFMSFGSLDSAKIFAQSSQKWLMVNLEHSILTGRVLYGVLEDNENCDLMNLISENFILWEVYQHSTAGTRYKSFYGPVTQFPHIAILDPATGEKLAVSVSLDHLVLKDFLNQFLSERPSPREEFSVVPLNSTNVSYTSNESTKTGKVTTNTMVLMKREEENLIRRISNVSISNSTVSHIDTGKIKASANRVQETSKREDKIKSKDASEVTNSSKTAFCEYNGRKFDFVIRFPNGERHHVSWPFNTTLHTLYLYIEENGYYMPEWEVIALHPRRYLTPNDSTKTFDQANLSDKEVLFVQEKPRHCTSV